MRVSVLVALLVASQTIGAVRAADAPLPAAPLPAATVTVDPAPASPSEASPAPSSQYRIGVGDVVQVQVYGEAGLSGQLTVDDGGSVNMPLLGPVSVLGLTAIEVSDLLRARLMPGYLVNPRVTASVSTYRSQSVQVLGGVAKPGLYYLTGPTTLQQLLGQAGGVSNGGVNEIRQTHAGQNDPTVVPYDQLLAGRDPPVVAGDIIFVPQSLVSVMGQVGHPGEIGFREGMTISQCIAAAGGALAGADLGSVYILRGEKRIRVQLRKILSGRAVDVVVQPGDRVFVRESAV